MENILKRRKVISRAEALAVRADYESGMTWPAISEKYGISTPTITDILQGTHHSLRDLTATPPTPES